MTTTFPKETFLTLNTKVTTHLNKIINNKTCYEIIIKRIYTLTLLQNKFQSKSKTDRSFIKQIHFEKTLLIFHTALYLINQTNSSISNESFLNSIINIYDNNISKLIFGTPDEVVNARNAPKIHAKQQADQIANHKTNA
jgi:hypothetical protein